MEEARQLYRGFTMGAHLFAVPDCFYYELGGVIHTAKRRARLTSAEAEAALLAIAELSFDTFTSQFFLPLAGAHARALDVSL